MGKSEIEKSLMYRICPVSCTIGKVAKEDKSKVP